MDSRKEFSLWTPSEINFDVESLSKNKRPKFSEKIRPLILMYKLFGLVSFSYRKDGCSVILVQDTFSFSTVAIKSVLLATTIYLWGAEPKHWRRQLDLTIFWLLLGASAYTENCFLDAINTIDKFDSLMYHSGSPLEVPRLNSRLLSGMCGILLFFTSIMHTLLYSHLSDKLISKRTLVQCLNYPLKTPRFTDYLIPLVGVVFYSQLIKRFLDLNTKWQGVVTALPDAAVPQKGIESVRLMHHDLCQANLNFNYYHGLQFLIFFLSIFLKLVTDLAFFLYLYIPDIELQCVVYVGYFINFTLFLAVSGSLLRVVSMWTHHDRTFCYLYSIIRATFLVFFSFPKQRVSCEVKKLQLSNLSSKCVSQVLLYLGQIKTDRCEVVANGFAHFDRPFMISIISATATALIVIIQMGPNTFHLTQADIEDDCC